MKNLQTLLTISILCTGCARLAPIVLDNLPEPEPPVVEEPVPEPPVIVEPEPEPVVEPDKRWPEDGSQELYSKRNSDNTGNLVVLLPSKWSNIFVDVWLIDKNGKKHKDTGRRNINLGSNNNGFRRHCWFNEKGQVYGQGILVVVLTTGKKEIPINFAKEKVKINF